MATESFVESTPSDPKTNEPKRKIRSGDSNGNGGVSKLLYWIMGVLAAAVSVLVVGWGKHMEYQRAEDRQSTHQQFSEVNANLESLRSRFEDQIERVQKRLEAQIRMEADLDYIKQNVAEIRSDLKAIKNGKDRDGG